MPRKLFAITLSITALGFYSLTCMSQSGSSGLSQDVTANAQKANALPAVLVNQDILDLVGAGINEEIVVEKIKTAPARNFDMSVSGIKSLKAAGVSDSIIKAMLQPAFSPQRRVTDELTTAYKQLENSRRYGVERNRTGNRVYFFCRWPDSN